MHQIVFITERTKTKTILPECKYYNAIHFRQSSEQEMAHFPPFTAITKDHILQKRKIITTALKEINLDITANRVQRIIMFFNAHFSPPQFIWWDRARKIKNKQDRMLFFFPSWVKSLHTPLFSVFDTPLKKLSFAAFDNHSSTLFCRANTSAKDFFYIFDLDTKRWVIFRLSVFPVE